MHKEIDNKFVLCIRNSNCEDLELKKIYQVICDDKSAKDGYLRIIDESGEDYLYPESYFTPIPLPEEAKELFLDPQKVLLYNR